MSDAKTCRILTFSVALIPFFSYKKCHLQALFVVKPRIAVCFVVGDQSLFIKSVRTAHAFGYVVAGHFEMNAAKVAAFSPVNSKRSPDLFKNIIKSTRLEAVFC